MDGTQPATPAQTTPATEAQPKEGQQISGVPQAGSQASGNPIKEAAAEAKRKLKIDNEEVDEDEVLKVYKARRSHQQAANKELQEGKKAKKQAEEFLTMMKDKQRLFDAIKQLGHDPRQLSEQYLAEVLTEEMMDPKEKELRDTRKRLQSYEENEKKEKERQAKEAEEKLKAKYADDYSKEFIEALKSTDLPATKEMVGQMAAYIARAAAIKFPMTAAEAAKLVQQDEDARVERRLANATPEQIVKILKEEGIAKVRGYDTARLKDPNAGLRTPTDQAESRSRREPIKRMTPQQWREFKRK